jgi:hypothetical protein
MLPEIAIDQVAENLFQPSPRITDLLMVWHFKPADKGLLAKLPGLFPVPQQIKSIAIYMRVFLLIKLFSLSFIIAPGQINPSLPNRLELNSLPLTFFKCFLLHPKIFF